MRTDATFETGGCADAPFLLAGTGVALPAQAVGSDAIDLRLGRPQGWLLAACGVAQRHVCGSETQDELAADAARAALRDAGTEPSAVDLVIFAAAVPKQPIPSTAPLVARRLAIPDGRCTAFDVNSTCLSFLTALDVAINMLRTGRFRCALVVSAEIASRALPWSTDPVTSGLFGDGAAAAVLRPVTPGADSSRVRAVHFETYHSGYDLCQLAAGGTGIDYHAEPERFARNSWFQMNGADLFKLSARHFPGFVDRLLARTGWTRADVDLVIPHQASPHALVHLVKRCGFHRRDVIDIVASHGNQIAASIPTALHIARTRGRLHKNAKVLLLGTSAGVSFGGMAIEL